MATGYILRTPKQNPGNRRHGVTVVNPLPRSTRKVRFGDGSGYAWATENPRKSSSKKRRSGQYTRSKTVTGRLVSRKKAGSTARKSTRATRTSSVRSGTRRSRPQSRTTARASGQVVTKRKKAKRSVKRVHKYRVKASKGRRSYFRKYPKKTRRTVRGTTRKGRLVRNAIPRWGVDVHPETRKAGLRGQKMSKAERAKWTSHGQARATLQSAKTYWQSDVHPGTKRPGIRGRQMTSAERKLYTAKGQVRSAVRGVKKVQGVVMAKKTTAKKAAKRRVHRAGVKRIRVYRKGLKGGRKFYLRAVKGKTSKTARRAGVRKYRVKASKGRKSYLRRYPKRTRKVARKTVRRAGVRKYRVKASKGRKSYLRKYPKRTRKVARKTRKVARRAGVRRYRVKASKGRKSYLRKYPKRTRKVARKTVRRAGVRKYRVKASKGRKSYLRKYPKRTRKVARKTVRRAGVRKYRVKASKGRKSYTRRYASKARKSTRRSGVQRYRVRKHGGGTYLRRYAKGRHHRYVKRATARRYSRKTTVRVPALRKYGKIVRKGYTYKRSAKIARNPYKRSKVRVHGYAYTRKHPKTKRVKVRGYRRSQWYPHREGGRWITQAKSQALGLLTKREMAAMARRHGLRANPGSALAMLPTIDQLKTMGLIAGEGFLGFGGAIAMGRALSAVPAISNVAGAWTSVLGNVAAGLGFWALAHFMPENEKLQEAKPYVMAGVGIAAVVNTILNLVGRGTIPSNIGSWMIPGVASAPVLPAMTPTAGFGQIDIYEAALDGVSGIESELEHELSRMGGGDGIFGDANEGIFSGLDGTGTPVREAYAGMGEYMKTPMGEYLQTPMGADVEEAFAGSGGMGEYFKTPMSGVNVEEAYSGMGEYFKAPMGAYVEEAFAGGMGFSPQQIGAEAVEQSLQTQPLMPGFRAAVQKLVRERISAGQPLDEAFYAKLGQASASMARRKFNQRVAQVAGQPQDIGVQTWKPPVTTASVPNFRIPVSDPSMVPGRAESIEDYESKEDEGIFSDGEDNGIF